MPKPTKAQIHSFKLFQKRVTRYEKRFQKHFFLYLRKTYNDAARYYKDNGAFHFSEINDPERLEKIFRMLYSTVTLNEAVQAYKEVVEPLNVNTPSLKEVNVDIEKKDIINDLIEILNPEGRGLINMWRSLLDDFLTVRLTNRITMINRTTEERIHKIIEESIFDGLGAEETARKIRRESGASLNVHRSRNIARTEVIVSANQGKYMAAQSSNLVMEKGWHAARDARTRHSHRDMLERDMIPLEDDFWVANDLGVLEPALFPGDERLSASNVVNCRCSIVFKPKRDENGNLQRKK